MLHLHCYWIIFTFLLSLHSIQTNPHPNPDDKTTTATTEEKIPSSVTESTQTEAGNDTASTDFSDAAGNSTFEEATLTLGPEDTTPENVFTDHFGDPVKGNKIMNISLPDGRVVQIYTEHWETYYTVPPTKPGCMCLTRAPIPKFKLIGNIHFPKIKVTPPRYVTLPTEAASTTQSCPPCVCPDCNNLAAGDN